MRSATLSSCVLVASLLSAGCDTAGRRERAAAKVNALVQRIEAGTDAASAMEELLESAKSSYDFERVHAVAALGKLGPLGEPGVPVLIDGLASPQFAVPRECALALGRIGPSAKEAVPALYSAFRARFNEDTGFFSLEAIALIAPEDPGLPAAIDIASKSNWDLMRDHARKAATLRRDAVDRESHN